MTICKYCGEAGVANPATHECITSFLIEKIDELREALDSSYSLRMVMDATARHERVEHAKTAVILRQIVSESGSYLQTKTREAAMERIACTGNCVCLPNPSDQRAGGSQP